MFVHVTNKTIQRSTEDDGLIPRLPTSSLSFATESRLRGRALENKPIATGQVSMVTDKYGYGGQKSSLDRSLASPASSSLTAYCK